MSARVLMALGLLALAGCQPAADAQWQGWIEADMVFVGPEDSGRIVAMRVAEGQQVKARDPLFAIDATLQAADVAAAEGALAQAQSDLAAMRARGLTDSHPDVIAQSATQFRRVTHPLVFQPAVRGGQVKQLNDASRIAGLIAAILADLEL